MIISALSQVSCFDTYNNMLASSGERYRFAVVGTTLNSLDSMMYFSDSKGGLTGPQTINTSLSACLKSEFADFNMDGNLDLLFIRQDNSHMMYFSDGKGNFTPGGTGLTNAGGLSQDSAITDIDNDGDPDIVIARTAPGDYILINNGSGDFTFNNSLIPGQVSNQVIAADFDMDGDKDLFFTTSTGKDYWRNDSNIFSHSGVNFGAATSVTEIASSDFDLDGDIDVVEVNIGGPSHIWLNNGYGSFSAGWAISEPNPHNDVAIADIDSDGDIDAYVCRAATDFDVILLNNGDGTFIEKNFNKIFPDISHASVFGDLDLDGDIDLVVSSSTALSVYHNNGYGQFSLYKSYTAIPSQSNISIGAIFQ